MANSVVTGNSGNCRFMCRSFVIPVHHRDHDVGPQGFFCESCIVSELYIYSWAINEKLREYSRVCVGVGVGIIQSSERFDRNGEKILLLTVR